MKTIYFGKVPTKFAEEDTHEYFHTRDGNSYYYALEADLEDGILGIRDTCNRYLPLDLEHISELQQALKYLAAYSTVQKQADDWAESRMQELDAFFRRYGYVV